MKYRVKIVFFLLLFFCGANLSSAQISGQINYYTKVNTIDYVCNKITVASLTNFTVGDTVLLIQMKGASFSSNDDANFGNITAIGDAGNYELGVISAINAGPNEIFFYHTFRNTYTPATGAVQLIYIPQYTDVTVGGLLTAKKWDGATGGVLVLQASGTVTLNADINVDSIGFRKGIVSVSPGPPYPGTAYYTPNCTVSGYYGPASTVLMAGKGEGIAEVITGREHGRGKQVNGGGGGHMNNTGGGGGANYGTGGMGGRQTSGCDVPAFGLIRPGAPGVGGTSLSTYYTSGTNPKIFMGGGGGGGQQNNYGSVILDNTKPPGPPNGSGASPGGAGGGIIIVIADRIEGNNYKITAKGENKSTYLGLSGVNRRGSWGDGAGGGGAGGTILLSYNTIGSMINADATGGKGDSVYTEVSINLGPGGGGGGGVIWISESSVNAAYLTTSLAGGINGLSYNFDGNSTTCNCAFQSTPGADGGTLFNLNITKGTTPFPAPCAGLPVRLIDYRAYYKNEDVILSWQTATETNNDHFLVERSDDGIHYVKIGTVKAKGNSNSITAYTLTDLFPLQTEAYYRLTQFDIDGTNMQLGVITVNPAQYKKILAAVFPVPVKEELHIRSNVSSETITIRIYNAEGTEISFTATNQGNEKTIDMSSLPKGLYTLVATDGERMEIEKIVK